MGGKKGGSSKGGAANKHKAGGACTEDDPTSSQYRVNACIVLAENFDEGCQIETLFGGGSEADRIAGLLPLPGGTTLLQHTVDLALDTLHLGNVYVLCRQCNTATVEGHLTRSKRMTVLGVADTCSSICEVLRAFGSGVTQCPLAQQDFLLLRGDSLAKPSVVKPIYDSILEYHTSRRKAAKSEYLMTRIFVSALADSMSNDDILTNIVMGTGGAGDAKGQLSDSLKQQNIMTGELLHWSAGLDSATVRLSEPLLHWGFGSTSKFDEIRYRTGVLGDSALGDVFSPDVFRLLEEEADYKSLRDDLVKLTIGAKFDDGVCPFGIGACVVPPLPHQLVRATTPRTYYEAAVTMMLEISPRDFLIPWPSHNVESRHLFASKDSKCTAGEHGGNSLAEIHGEIAYIDTRARVDPSARLHQCYIAPGATIGAGVELESSIIGPDVVVGAGASIRKCIIHARSTVSPSTSVECVVVSPNGNIIASNKAHPVDGVTIGTPLPDTAQALAKIEAARVSREGSISTEEPTEEEEEDIANSSCGTDKAFKKGFRAEVYAFFKEGWYEKQDVSHVCQQLRIYRTTEQAPLSELLIATVLALARVCCEVLVSDSSKPKQPVVASFYEYWDDALEELYLTDQTGLSKWWIEALDNLCASCPQYGQDFEKECCLFIWGMYANDYLSKEDLLAWWSRAPDTYRQLPLMAQLIGQIEEQSDDDDSDDDSEDDSDSE